MVQVAGKGGWRVETAPRVTAKGTNAKLACRRLTVLELAQRLGNVAEACRRGGLSFYGRKRRFRTHGLDRLKDLPPIARSHPMTTPAGVVERIEALAPAHPADGCNRLEAMPALEGRRRSAITIQKIRNDKGRGTRHERRLALVRQNAERVIGRPPEQAALLERLDPCLKERRVESERPAELLSAGTFMVGTLKGLGRVQLHAVGDSFGSYAFDFLHASKQPEAAVAVLHNGVLPFCQDLDLPIRAVLIDNGRELCGTERHPHELYLASPDLEHRRTELGRPRTNGFPWVWRLAGPRASMDGYRDARALGDFAGTNGRLRSCIRPPMRPAGRGPWWEGADRLPIRLASSSGSLPSAGAADPGPTGGAITSLDHPRMPLKDPTVRR